VSPRSLSSATPARTEAELDARLATLERSLDSTASAEAAENLLNAFGYYADEHMWDAAAQLFATDGWAAVPGVGIYAGRERLRAALQATFGGRRAKASSSCIRSRSPWFMRPPAAARRGSARVSRRSTCAKTATTRM
jgi:hypothetical protein